MALAYHYVARNRRKSALLIVLFALSTLVFVYLAVWGFYVMAGVLAYLRPTGFLTWGSTFAHAFVQTADTCRWLLPVTLAISLFWAHVALKEGETFILGRFERRVRFLHPYDEANTLLTELCIRTGDIVPRIYELRDKGLNAFSVGATFENSAIVLSEGLLKKLDRVQLEAVLAHELAHIRNGDTRLMTVLVMCLAFFTFAGEYLFYGTEKENIYDENGLQVENIRQPLGPLAYIGFMLLLYGYVVAPLLRLGLSRTCEYLADAEAALITRHPRALAKALWHISQNSRLGTLGPSVLLGAMCIENPSQKSDFFGWISGLYSAHPPVEDRIYALNDMDGMFLHVPSSS